MVAKIKLLLSWLGASQISRNNTAGWFEVRFGTLNERQIDRLVKEAASKPKLYRLSPDYKLYVYWDKESTGSSMEDTADTTILATLLKTLEPLTAGLEPS
jgi:hypothetical protein